MKPKVWGDVTQAVPVAVGEARARFNKTLDVPFTTASGPGFQADKKLEFNEVFIDSPEGGKNPLPRFYCLGRIGDRDQLSGSYRSAKGTFRKLGEIKESAFSIPNVGYIGMELGVVPGLDDPDNHVWSFWGTKDAKHFKKLVTFQSYTHWLFSYRAWLLVPGSQSGIKRSSHTWGIALNHYDGHYYTVYAFWDGANKSWNLGGSLRYVDYDCGAAVVSTAPGVLMAFTVVFREAEAEVDGDGYLLNPDPGSAPKCFLSKSIDKGYTWSYIPITSVWDDYVNAMSRSGFNAAVGEMGHEVNLFPLTPTLTAVVIPFTKHVAYNAHGWEIDSEQEFRVYHLVGSSMALVATLDTDVVSPEDGYFITETLACRTGVLILDFVYRPGYSGPHILCFSFDNGATWTYREKPWPAHVSGTISWVEDTLVCPAYIDGEHALFETENYGVTWTKRATIRSDGDTPSAGATLLQAFNLVREFRKKDGTPAAVTPGAPWISDSKESYVPP